MGRGKLLFKGDSDPKKKKKKKSKHTTSGSGEAHTVADGHGTLATSRLPQPTASASTAASASVSTTTVVPKVVSCTGEITTSGKVVSGYGTKFEREISVGDALIVMIKNSQTKQTQQEMRIVTMRLSNISLSLSSPFSESIKSPTSFSVIRKPRDEAKQRRLAERKEQLTRKEEEEKASGTFGSTEELVYREHRPTYHGTVHESIQRANNHQLDDSSFEDSSSGTEYVINNYFK